MPITHAILMKSNYNHNKHLIQQHVLKAMMEKTTKGNTGVKADREHNHRKRPGFKSRLGTMIMFFGFIWFG
jgi:hypothetical protein